MSLNKDEIRNILGSVADLDHQAELSYRYLPDGITNENYWLSLNQQQYVLRLNNPDSDRLGLDRDVESAIMERVSVLDFVPEVIYCSKELRISNWLKGVIWNKKILERQVNLNRLAQKLKQLHALPCHDLPVLDMLGRLDQYRTMSQQRHGQLPAAEQRLLPYAIKVLGSIKHRLPACLCHNDLLSANILGVQSSNQEKIYFLDWEYAAINDPLFELAVICRGNHLSEASQQYFLQAYLGESAGEYIKAFTSWCWFYEYLSLLWGLVILPADIGLPNSLDQTIQKLMDTLPNR